MNSIELKNLVIQNLDSAINSLNQCLTGRDLYLIKDTLKRLNKNKIPTWYNFLEKGIIPNADGKTIGSIIENIFTAVIENLILLPLGHEVKLEINPAKGVDIPQLNLGVKSPSENFCTSEPFFSAYERILGNEYDAIILLTDYQESKKISPLKIKIKDFIFLKGSEIADKNLCSIAKHQREFVLSIDEPTAKKYFKFICYINQSDWYAKKILELFKVINLNDSYIKSKIIDILSEYDSKNRENEKSNKPTLTEEYKNSFQNLLNSFPLHSNIINLADNWVVQEHKDFGRIPNDNEWKRIMNSPLNGKISISMALQWRYNFGTIFKNNTNQQLDLL